MGVGRRRSGTVWVLNFSPVSARATPNCIYRVQCWMPGLQSGIGMSLDSAGDTVDPIQWSPYMLPLPPQATTIWGCDVRQFCFVVFKVRLRWFGADVLKL